MDPSSSKINPQPVSINVSLEPKDFPDFKFARLLVLSGFIQSILYNLNSVGFKAILETALPHSFKEKYDLLNSLSNFITYGNAFSLILLGALSDHFGKKSVTTFAITAASLLFIPLGFIKSQPIILVFAGLVGLSSGLNPIIYSLFSEEYKGRRVAYAVIAIPATYMIAYIFTYCYEFFQPYTMLISDDYMIKFIIYKYPNLVNTIINSVMLLVSLSFANQIIEEFKSDTSSAQLAEEGQDESTSLNQSTQNSYGSITISSTVNTISSGLSHLRRVFSSLFTFSNQTNTILVFVLTTVGQSLSFYTLQFLCFNSLSRGGLEFSFNNLFKTPFSLPSVVNVFSIFLFPYSSNLYGANVLFHKSYKIITLITGIIVALVLFKYLIITPIAFFVFYISSLALYSCYTIALLSSNVIIANQSTNDFGYGTKFGLAYGLSFLVLGFSKYWLINAFNFFANLNNYYVNLVNPSLIILLAFSFVTFHFSKPLLHTNQTFQ